MNLQAGRLRLIFVADEIPPELRRIVEFLNGQMDPAEVLAVEIKQYVGRGLTTLVPRVVGQTAEAEQKKTVATGPRRQWDARQFMAELAARRGRSAVYTAQVIHDWAQRCGFRIWWGQGKKDGSFFPLLDVGGVTHWLIAVWTYGRIEVQFQHMHAPPFNALGHRMELRRRLVAIPGIEITDEAVTKRPSFPLAALEQPASLKQFLEVLEWWIQEVNTH
jgi:hypothetical protein